MSEKKEIKYLSIHISYGQLVFCRAGPEDRNESAEMQAGSEDLIQRTKLIGNQRTEKITIGPKM